jgi:uncharacterized membrane protein
MDNKFSIKDSFVTGIFALLPLTISVALMWWILVKLWEMFFSAFVPGVDIVIQKFVEPDQAHYLESMHVHQIVGLALLLLFIACVGFVARRYIGKSLLALVDKLISLIPGLNFIYGTIRQFTATMDPDSPQHDAFRHAVVVKVQGMRFLGFLTSRSRIEGKEFATVFLPCNQLIQGYNIMVPAQDVMSLDMRVDEAVKYVISFGIVAPPVFQAQAKAVLPAPAIPAPATKRASRRPAKK